MMLRRRLLLGLLAMPVAASGLPAAAQEAPEAAPAPAAPPRRRRRPVRRRLQPAPEPIRPLAQQPPSPAQPQLDAAPVPNRDIEAPRTVHRDEPAFSATLMHRRLPGRGLAAEGSYHAREERLFTPGPGARLSLPFSY